MAEDVARSLPDRFKDAINNVVVTTAGEPADYEHNEFCSDSRYESLGIYSGVPVTRRGPASCMMVLPDRITIFKGPHERLYGDDKNALKAQVRKTVLYEFGH